MENEKLILHASKINNTNREKAKKAYEILLDYFTQPFIDVDTKESKKLIKRIKRIGGQYAQKLIIFIETPISDESIDKEIKKSVEEAHIEEKEFNEAKEFYRKVKPLFPDKLDYVVDICSGNGLNGLYWLLQGATKHVVFVDIDENSNFRQLERILQPDNQKYELNQSGIDNYTPPKGKTLITAIHACGNLTDKAIDLAINNNHPFAVMPCCYSNKDNGLVDDNLLEYFYSKTECLDILRLNKIQEASYKPLVREISPVVTKQNRILIGVK